MMLRIWRHVKAPANKQTVFAIIRGKLKTKVDTTIQGLKRQQTEQLISKINWLTHDVCFALSAIIQVEQIVFK